MQLWSTCERRWMVDGCCFVVASSPRYINSQSVVTRQAPQQELRSPGTYIRTYDYIPPYEYCWEATYTSTAGEKKKKVRWPQQQSQKQQDVRKRQSWGSSVTPLGTSRRPKLPFPAICARKTSYGVRSEQEIKRDEQQQHQRQQK